MLESLRFRAYCGAMSAFTLLSFRMQKVTPLGLPVDGAVRFRPFSEAFPDMPVAALVDPADFPDEGPSRLRRIALSAALLGVVGKVAPSRTDQVPPEEAGFVDALYPWAFRRAWPTPPSLPPRLSAVVGRPDADLLAELAVDGPFGSYLRTATEADQRDGLPTCTYVIDLDDLLDYPARPGLLRPGGVAHFDVVGGRLTTVGISRAGEVVPLAAWRGRQVERDAFLAGINEDLTTIRHNVFVHLATLTPFALASSNHLPVDHPVRRLLHHCFHTVLIGNRELGQLQLGGSSAFASTIFSHDGAEVARLANDRLAAYDVWDFEPDQQFARRGTMVTPFAYPYRDNVMELWSVTLAYVRRYLALYFADDDSAARDEHVASWLDSLDRLLPNGVGRTDLTVEWLARLCATVIHVSTVEHDVLNNVTWDYSTLGWLIPTVAPLNGERMDQRRAFDLLATIIVTWKPYNMLLTADVPSLALDAPARAVMSEWISDLEGVQQRMAAGGEDVALAYPAHFNVSISN